MGIGKRPISQKSLNWPFWANFENSRFLTIFEVSYGPKQWRYTAFDVEFGFSAVDYPYRWILSPMLGDLYGFPEAPKVRFSAVKVGTQENLLKKFPYEIINETPPQPLLLNLRWPKLPKTALNLIDELTRVIRTRKKCWNWILKKSPKFDLWIHRNPPKCQIWQAYMVYCMI